MEISVTSPGTSIEPAAHSNDHLFLPTVLVQNLLFANALFESMAFLEIGGAKGIMAVAFKNWTAEIHEHAGDEVDHALRTQKAARDLRCQLVPSDLLKEPRLTSETLRLTQEFLWKLTKKIFYISKDHSGDSWFFHSYVVLSFLIERRLMTIYPHIAVHGGTAEMRRLCRSLVNDERRHLTHVTGLLAESLKILNLDRADIIKIEEEMAEEWIRDFAAICLRTQ